VTFYTRSSWADPANTAKLRPAPKPSPIAYVHHSGGGQGGLTIQQWARVTETAVTSHAAPGNSAPLAAIDYNELIDNHNGDVCEGRGLAYEDAATLQQNQISASWCVVGNFQVETPSQAALASLAERIGWACDHGYLVPRAQVRVLGHRDDPYFPTACPGQNLYAALPGVLAVVRGAVPQPPVASLASEGDSAVQNVFYPVLKQDHSFWIDKAGLLRHAWPQGDENLTATLKVNEVLLPDRGLSVYTDGSNLDLVCRGVVADGACGEFRWGASSHAWGFKVIGR
jgi:hypothetical protein